MGAPQVDTEWIDPSWWGQIAPTGAMDQPHPKNYRLAKFLEAIQSGQNMTAIGTLGTPNWPSLLGSDPSLPKGEATYKQ